MSLLEGPRFTQGVGAKEHLVRHDYQVRCRHGNVAPSASPVHRGSGAALPQQWSSPSIRSTMGLEIDL